MDDHEIEFQHASHSAAMRDVGQRIGDDVERIKLGIIIEAMIMLLMAAVVG